MNDQMKRHCWNQHFTSTSTLLRSLSVKVLDQHRKIEPLSPYQKLAKTQQQTKQGAASPPYEVSLEISNELLDSNTERELSVRH